MSTTRRRLTEGGIINLGFSDFGVNAGGEVAGARSVSGHNPVGVDCRPDRFSQGSSRLLGFETESLWDSMREAHVAGGGTGSAIAWAAIQPGNERCYGLSESSG